MRTGFLFDAETSAAATPTTQTGGFGSWPVIKQIAWVFGLIMQGIFVVLAAMGVISGMVPLCIIVFTIVTKMLLLPLTIKQQRFTKINAVMTPEIQALQKKYEGKRDQVSMTKMRAEQQAIYDKYGTSMSAGCLPSLIQLPLLFGLPQALLRRGEFFLLLLQGRNRGVQRGGGLPAVFRAGETHVD